MSKNIFSVHGSIIPQVVHTSALKVRMSGRILPRRTNRPKRKGLLPAQSSFEPEEMNTRGSTREGV